MKRQLLAVASIALVAASACKGPGASLVVAINAGVEGDALKSAAREWGQSNSVAVEVVELPYANLFEKELLDLSSRSGAYDVIMMDDPWFPRMAVNGNLAPVTWEPDPDFLESCVRVCREPYSSGPLYALPYVGNSQLFFYRKDLFDKHGLAAPATWSDVLEAARKITVGQASRPVNGSEKMYGYVMRAAPGNAVVTDFMPLFWAFGAEMFAGSGAPAVDSAEGIESLRFMIELGKFSPPGYAGFNADEVSAHLLQSTAAMSINWPAWIASMDNPAKSKVVGKIEYAQMPSAKRKGVAELGAWLLGVPVASKNRERAFEFIRWATDAERMKQAALRGNPPTRRSVFLLPELRARFRSYPAQLASLESARPRPRTTQWNEVENAFGISLSQANSGRVKPEEAMQRAASEIAGILKRAR